MSYIDRTKEELTGKIKTLKSRLDAHESKGIESAYAESQQRLSDIINFLPDATFAIDLEGKVIIWNKAMELMSGVDAAHILGKGDHEYSVPFYGSRRPILIDLIFASEKEIQDNYQFVTKVEDSILAEAAVEFGGKGLRNLWGKASPLYNAKGEIIGAIEAIRDVTAQKTAEHERNQLQLNLQRAEKMEDLGNLAGGVAHDLNNVLGVIIGYSQLILRELTDDNPVKRRIDNILKSGIRAAAIVEDLLTLARSGVLVREAIDLNLLIRDFFYSPEFSEIKKYHPKIHLKCSLQNDLSAIEGSPVHFEKSLFNLCCNGAEAMPNGGELLVSTQNCSLESPLEGYDHIVPGKFVLLTVTDNGEGIATKDLKHIFEPFYTKKAMGKSGTGLGLAEVWGTVKDHNGYITVRSKLNEGTSFHLYIPVTENAPASKKQQDNLSAYEARAKETAIYTAPFG